MKLKKIVSLAMAGVLAVSMLAGCNNGTGSSSSTPEQSVAKDLTSQVVAKLNEELDGKVTVTAASANSKPQTVLQDMINYYGAESFSSIIDYQNLNKFGVEDASMTDIQSAGEAASTDSKKETICWNGGIDTSDSNVSYVAESIVKNILSKDNVGNSWTLKTLPKNGNKLTKDGKNVYYDFEYTVEIAVMPVVNTSNYAGGASDLAGYTTGYAYVYSLTRTPTEMPA